MNHLRGRLRISGYEVLEYLGSGARSTIWRVRKRRTNRFFALKRVFKQNGDDDRFFDQAENEFEVAAKFDHPAIRKYYNLRRVRKWFKVQELHLMMELCHGSSCQGDRPTDMVRIAEIFLVVAQALAYMHSRGFVHADIKPNNIIVSDDGVVKIIDFGQSCRIGMVKERIQGTPDFIAPEQVLRRPLDGRTDVFNFGATLYWTLTGRAIPTLLPKAGAGIQLLNDMRVTPPEELNPGVPPSLSRLALDCVETKSARRPQSAKDVITRLDLIVHTLTRNERRNKP